MCVDAGLSGLFRYIVLVMYVDEQTSQYSLYPAESKEKVVHRLILCHQTRREDHGDSWRWRVREIEKVECPVMSAYLVSSHYDAARTR